MSKKRTIISCLIALFFAMYLPTSTVAYMTDSDVIQDTFNIAQTSIENAEVTGIADKEFTGEAITQDVTVTIEQDGEVKTLVNGTDYDVAYENNINEGTATVIITGKGLYTGTVVKNFEITAPPSGKQSVQKVQKSITAEPEEEKTEQKEQSVQEEHVNQEPQQTVETPTEVEPAEEQEVVSEPTET